MTIDLEKELNLLKFQNVQLEDNVFDLEEKVEDLSSTIEELEHDLGFGGLCNNCRQQGLQPKTIVE